MTTRQKADAEEMRQDLFNAANWICLVCQKSLVHYGTAQLAHRVPRRKSMLMRWGEEVINHPLNMVPVCSLKCNDSVSLGTVKAQTKDILERIVRIKTGRESMPNLAEYYRAVGQEVRGKIKNA